MSEESFRLTLTSYFYDIDYGMYNRHMHHREICSFTLVGRAGHACNDRLSAWAEFSQIQQFPGYCCLAWNRAPLLGNLLLLQLAMIAIEVNVVVAIAHVVALL